MKVSKKILNIFLSIAIVLTASNYVYATSNTDEIANHASHQEGAYRFDPEEIIEALSIEELERNECIKRQPNMENDMHTVVYKCIDGNYVAYFFQYPVKYLDPSGKIKDINTSIRSSENIPLSDRIQNNKITQLKSEYAYSSEDNSIKVFYSDNLARSSSAVVANHANWTVGLAPYVPKLDLSRIETNLYTNENTQVLAESVNRATDIDGIEYKGVFDDRVSLYYHTTYTGYKELIKINSPTNKNLFQFVLTTDGLLPKVSENGEVILIEPTTKQIIASFAELYVYDSSDVPLYTLNNRYVIDPIDSDSDKYLITVCIDNVFLTDSDTVYPVIVDPTFSFITSSAIDDAPIYSGIPSSAQGANYYNHVGYVDSSYGTGSLLVKFPGLKDSTWFNGLRDSRINSVTYNVKKTGGSNEYSSTLCAYRYTGTSWNENTVTYNSAAISSHTGSSVSSISMRAHSWYSFNITSAVIDWKNGLASYDSGLIIKNITNGTSSSYDRILASVEYGTSINSSCMPYITVVYNNGTTSAAFTSANLAAKDFAQSVYSSCEYSRIEYGAVIYYLNGRYYYYNVHSGLPHNVAISSEVPSGSRRIAYIHTHPNSEYFSSGDKAFAAEFDGDAYLVTPSHSLKRYFLSTDTTTTVYTDITINPLTASEKTSLRSALSSVWYGHIVNGACNKGYGCENKTWPNE